MLDLRKSDMILVKVIDEKYYEYAYLFVEVMRRHGHEQTWVYQTTIEQSEQEVEDDDDFDYKLDETKIAQFEEIHELVKNGNAS